MGLVGKQRESIRLVGNTVDTRLRVWADHHFLFQEVVAPQSHAQAIAVRWSLVRELWTAGATVYLCKGLRPKGSLHGKAVVIDRRYLFTGGVNATYKSHSNEEFVFRISGSAVGQVFEKLGAQRAKSKTWKGY